MSTSFVLGLGGTVDYEIRWDSRVVEALVLEYAIRAAEVSATVPIESERDLLRTLLAFVRDGVGGERFVASSDIVEVFAARFERRITLGGTCVRAALAMDKLGIPSTVHLVSIDDHVRRLLPASVDYLCSATQDTTDPHLIVQFAAGAHIAAGDVDVTAAHPNRIIYTNDPPNRELRLSPDLGPALTDADVFLVSGFNTIQDPTVLDERLAETRKAIEFLPDRAVVVYEDAGFHVPALAAHAREALVDLIDVYSLNEDELQAYVGRSLDLLDAGEVAEALLSLHHLVPVPALVVHTKHWALAVSMHAWRYRAALRGGVTMAGVRYLLGDGFTADDYAGMVERPVSPEGVAFGEAIESALPDRVVCVPAFALTTDDPTTIGLGDTFVGGFLAALS